MRIAIIAGEASGDILGSRLITAMLQQNPALHFEGIAGVEMETVGCTALYPIEKLSVMGFSEVLPKLREILSIRKALVRRWQQNPPDLFIGIDAPDFNLKLEALLHKKGIKTAHYVSPSVWAWRESRVKKIKGNIDQMLTLFPFEVDFYNKHQIPATFVGHPLADEIPLQTDQRAARKQLGLADAKHTLAILPGSRSGEIKRIAPDFLQALKRLHQQYPDWQFIVPLINPRIRQQFEALIEQITPLLPIILIDGQSRSVMSAADQILMASGTAVLEGMLINRPMIAAYRVTASTAFIIRTFKMIKSKYYTLPNNLCDEYLVPELIQEQVTAENICKEVDKQFQQSQQQRNYNHKHFHIMHLQLRKNASQRAAEVLLGLLK
ncbi:MAG: lipid-A-disaccharide synthase [Cocleimonas sp.]|nr:lipid-A-disaccharide synthase [Cocleimonas sp.]